MDLLGNIAFRDWVARFLVALFLTGATGMLVAGLGLIFRSAATLRFFAFLNRWVSTRRTLRSVEIPRDTGPAVRKYRGLLGTIFIVGGSFAIYSLATEYNTRGAILLLGLDIFRLSFAMWVADSIRWVLIAGNAAGVVVGFMLVFFPDALVGLEARGSRWFSERRVMKRRDEMNLFLDDWVARHPEISGCVITVFALVLLAAFGLLVPAIR